jgi:hypothetical protein
MNPAFFPSLEHKKHCPLSALQQATKLMYLQAARLIEVVQEAIPIP